MVQFINRTTGFLNQQNAGGNIGKTIAQTDGSVNLSGCDIGQIQTCGAKDAQRTGLRDKLVSYRSISAKVFLIVNLRRENTFAQFLTERNAQPFMIAETLFIGAVALFGKIKLVRGRIVNDGSGVQVTVKGDKRITRIGKFLRRFRLDETPQLFDVFRGKMTFVGTRPEVAKYVKRYTPEMMATLLLPAGVTSTASIAYKDEDRLLKDAVSPDDVYVKQILPEKMKYNLEYLKNFGFFYDIRVMIRTVTAVAE